MTDILQKARDFLYDLEVHLGIRDEVKTVQNEVKAIVHNAGDYITKNGLQDLYQIALTLLPALTGQSWTDTIAAVEAKAVELGKELLEGTGAVIAAQAQADLIAIGSLTVPKASTNAG